MEPDDYALSHIRELHAYTPGQQPQEEGWIKLNTNENPYPPSPRVREAILTEMGEGGERLRLYPEPLSRELREATARFHDLEADCVIYGNGSDDLLNLLVRVFCGGDKAAGMLRPSYSLYPVLAGIQNGQLLEVPFDRSMKLDAKAIAATRANLFFLTSPNAPTGVGFTTHEIREVLARTEGILVVDEAYAAFAQEDATALVRESNRVVITRSFSKSHGLAGLRVGYALAQPDMIALLDRVRESYNLDRLAQAGALAALEDNACLQDVVQRVNRTRDRTIAALRKRGWVVYDSQANFLFGEPVDGAGKAGASVAQSLFEHLNNQRILVRYFPGHPLTCSFLRISVGTDEQMERFLEAVDAWQNNA